MAAKITQGFIDRSGEHSRTQYYLPFNPADADDFDSLVGTPADAVHDAMAVVTLCNFTDQSASIEIQSDTPIVPSSVNAQRELALWVQYVDEVTGEYGSMSIPGPNLTLLGQANTDEVDIVSNVTMAAFVVVLEANLSSRDGNDIEVVRARIIGRRN
jgi:hypothetical protein